MKMMRLMRLGKVSRRKWEWKIKWEKDRKDGSNGVEINEKEEREEKKENKKCVERKKNGGGWKKRKGEWKGKIRSIRERSEGERKGGKNYRMKFEIEEIKNVEWFKKVIIEIEEGGSVDEEDGMIVILNDKGIWLRCGRGERVRRRKEMERRKWKDRMIIMWKGYMRKRENEEKNLKEGEGNRKDRKCRIRWDVEKEDIEVKEKLESKKRSEVMKDRIGIVVKIEGRIWKKMKVEVEVLRDWKKGKGDFIREGEKILRLRKRECEEERKLKIEKFEGKEWIVVDGKGKER